MWCAVATHVSRLRSSTSRFGTGRLCLRNIPSAPLCLLSDRLSCPEMGRWGDGPPKARRRSSWLCCAAGVACRTAADESSPLAQQRFVPRDCYLGQCRAPHRSLSHSALDATTIGAVRQDRLRIGLPRCAGWGHVCSYCVAGRACRSHSSWARGPARLQQTFRCSWVWSQWVGESVSCTQDRPGYSKVAPPIHYFRPLVVLEPLHVLGERGRHVLGQRERGWREVGKKEVRRVEETDVV